MVILYRVLLTLIILVTLSCGSSDVEFDLPQDLRASTEALSRWDGSPGGMALVEFLNEGTTTEEVLDYDVGLDSRAAGNIIGHRDGGDARFGTTDDDLFDSVAEIDRVRWVGPTTIRRMIKYIENMDRVPEYDENLGTWDGVRFTVDQAQATLRFANNTSEEVLDYDLGLNSRAVESIIENRPVGTVAHLAGLYYVGKRALRRLRNAAMDDRE